MKDSAEKMTRRKALSGLIILPAFAGFLASTASIAEAKGSQSQYKYQNHPSGGHKCMGCRFFQPGKTPSANGACQLVSGSISPNGWCIAYTAK